MVRKTKEEAAATRLQLLDAAERLFSEKGVSHTSLHEIALAAGLTRGAIYWHFEDKGDLLKAMWERVALPIHDAICSSNTNKLDPLTLIRSKVCWMADHIEEDPRIFALMNIVMLRCEFTDETRSARDHFLHERETCQRHLLADFDTAIATGALPPHTNAEHAMQGIFGLVDGICFHWLIQPQAFCIRQVTHSSVDCFLAGLQRSR
ncbi:MAG: hypothetical protein CGU28_01480 [Candidatus Dactylopiibacterium carminicum]|uniref:HTH tetR-type domain-containing protein n=1 Tax=Candidatus Dactylopiibacterium carminicum TaxID=857335 RepID=A0A272EUG3_9RHOO|nr:TetR family transcriptional regulator [Candidatus Dactylopiibacterium carminicum]KAF7599779.1 hypothetical protein BGI27_06170 [Candidatus Dactylopiibacterium carminicum]PAS93733.1 MAG: hypothetical protein CGU29_06610 [Candidatus Dactylopiibacterium carminicum]PAS98266.1 MAG: hypothetical protein CGU28_01480 [Candidatus Dactylopiibacterium carminicum]PAS99780.1 MAG: hypothetical protein BSR46_06205 [Candidatus Dactylopiibacterium carminicum]